MKLQFEIHNQHGMFGIFLEDLPGGQDAWTRAERYRRSLEDDGCRVEVEILQAG